MNAALRAQAAENNFKKYYNETYGKTLTWNQRNKLEANKKLLFGNAATRAATRAANKARANANKVMTNTNKIRAMARELKGANPYPVGSDAYNCFELGGTWQGNRCD